MAVPAAGERTAARMGLPAEAWMALGVFALAVLCYANTVRGEFVFDDIKLIVNNDIVKDPARVSEVLLTNLWGLLGRATNYYRPLPPLLFMLLHALFGMRPEPFHVVNIALHAGTTCLVFLTARALLRATGVPAMRAAWSAFAAAALFAAHPVHTEAVAWISGVMDVSCTFFSLAAIYAYVTRDAARWGAVREALSLVALALGLLSKEPAAVVPFALVAYDLLFCRERVQGPAAALRRWGPPFAVLAAYLALRAVALGGVAPFQRQEQDTWAMLLTVPWLFARYLQKLVLPVALNVAHHVTPVTSPVSRDFLVALGTLAIFAAVIWTARRAGRVAGYGLLLFLLTVAPVLYVPALGQDLSKAFAERYLYFPSAGAALALAAGLAALAGRSRQWYRGALVAAGVVTVLFSGMTVSRNTVWANSLTLWSDCVQKSPDMAMAREGLGLALIRRGKAQEGARELQAALRLDPDVAQNALRNGVLAARAGLSLQAVLYFQTALLYTPDLVDAHYNQALVFEQLGWTPAAIQGYLATLRHDPGHADAHNNLGILLAETNRLDAAIEHFLAAVRARPQDAEVRLNLARAYDAKGLAKEAAQQRALAALAGGKLTPAR